jgi:tRNA-specific 2-thiouridylase
MAERVVVAMSGGVDSSVAAALLVEQGYEVIGVMLRLWAELSAGEASLNRCCSPEAVNDARRVAARLGIPFYLRNVEEAFKARVVDYFIAGYAAGETPNPCLACNRDIRFGLLLRHALGLGATYLATGHYARVRRGPDGRYQLLKGVDERKDQSYPLHVLGQEQLAHALFPLGAFTKAQVREMARARGLPVADKAESQELCFIADDDYRRFLRHWAPQVARPGPILDRRGRVLGEHQGLFSYTIGQRKGLGLSSPVPLYVLEIDADRNALIVGTAEELGRRELTAREVNWIAGEPPAGPIAVTARIRYKAREVPATVTPLPDRRAAVSFATALRDITPGQAVVFYEGEVCLGGGIIEPG